MASCGAVGPYAIARQDPVMILSIAGRRSCISDPCRRDHVRRLDLFGSAARAEYESDVSPPPLGEFFALGRGLSVLLGRKIDLTMAGAGRNPFIRDAIERSRQTLHGA